MGKQTIIFTFVVAFALGGMAESASALSWIRGSFTAQQDGDITMYATIYGLHAYDLCTYTGYTKGDTITTRTWANWPVNDVEGEQKCDDTGKTTTTKLTAVYTNPATGHLDLLSFDDYATTLGVTPSTELNLIGLNNNAQDLYVTIDATVWSQAAVSWAITNTPGPDDYYDFTDGLCDDLPGVFVSNEPVTWVGGDPPISEATSNSGWASSSWFTGETYTCHEYEYVIDVPEPASLALLTAGAMVLLRRRRGVRGDRKGR